VSFYFKGVDNVAMTQAQQLMEVKRKASQGIALSDPTNKANQAVWNTTNTNLNNEINRKADNNITLADPNNAYVKKLYDARVTANSTKEGPTTTDPTTDQPPTTQQNAGFDLKSIYDNMYSSQAQKLKDARDQALAGLAGQEDVIGQNRISQLNNNDALAAKQLQALRENMANNGLNASGDSISAQLGLNTSTQQEANGIETNSGNQLKQLFAQRDQIKNSANADDLALLQGIQSQQGLAQQSQYNTDRGYGLDLAQLSGRLPGNGGQTLAGQQFDYSKLTDQRNYDRGVVESDRGYELQKATTEWNQAFQQGQFDFQKAQAVWDNTFKTKSFDQSIKEAAASRGLQWANLNQSQQQFMAKEAWDKQVYADTQGWKQKEWDYMQDPSNPANKTTKVDFTAEYQGLDVGLKSGSLPADVAILEIQKMVKARDISAAEAQQLMNLVAPYKAKQLTGK
jgi:hypothetical protein